ncbi:uncharacterized protein LOC123294236 [Chrysoperla carnea]|uniref:uncharacterized protein LOC123294236 n=1 Tax=Chrysoperla carnea TaxID=189513 RepID=UPI001D08B681|nr:uncharacterized protein LOC123294236 [Chrysoperla carnea]
MHYRLTVLWIFIIWVFVGITESRPQNEPHLDRGSWKPFIPSIPERIHPQPSVDQHNSRVRIENEQEKNEISHRQARIDKPTIEHTTIRQNKAASPAIRDSIKAVTNQLLDPSNVTLDTRTPPKIKAHHKPSVEKIKPVDVVENSHAGIAVPVNEDEIKELEEQTKKIAILRNQNKIQSTTDSGLSTWILLSGQPSTTMKSVTKSEPNKEIKTDKYRINNKMRTTTRKPIATTTESSVEVTEVISIANNTKIVNKVKASILANSMKEKHTATGTTTVKPQTTTTLKNIKASSKKNSTNVSDTSNEESKIEENKINSSVLPIEAKDGDLDLTTEPTNKKSGSTKKPPRSTTTTSKRKKNKNRRKRPSSNKTVNGTKTAIKPQTKEKPISTQVYNYLSREVLPTVGVGLVGLMVTAGLASYFLYPFGVAARRAYNIADRKDDKYYYNNGDYGYGGQPEEDVINKVVAGMPASSSGLEEYIYAKPTNENRYKSPYQETPETQQNVRYRQSNSPSYPTYSASYSQDKVSYNQINKYGGQNENTFNYNTDYSTPKYGADIIAEHQKESGYTVSGIPAGSDMNAQKFVVGNIPKDIIVTPAAVPEHGPRSLKLRRRRRRNTLEKHSKSIENNEILDDIPSNNVHLSGGFLSNNFNLPSEIQNNTFDPTANKDTEPKNNVTKLSLVPQKPSLSQISEVPSQIAQVPSQIADLPSNLPIDSGLSIFSFFKSLLEFKMRLGLSIMQHMTEALGRYIHSTLPPKKPQYDDVDNDRTPAENLTQHQNNKNGTVIKREGHFYN